MMITPSPFLDFQPPKENELISWIRLNRTLNLNSRLFYQLLQHYGSAEDVLRKIPLLSKLGRLPFFSMCSEQIAEQELKKVQDLKGEIILLGSPFYPSILLSVPNPPPLLTVLGNKTLLNQKIIGGTGCRKASPYATQFAEHLAYKLRKNKYVLASGLSEGIEISFHKGSLSQGTIVILPGGIDIIAPLKHKELSEKILDHQGVFISEFPLGIFPTSSHFLRQTRLVSGISKGVILIEATVHSTAFHLTEMALEQGRDVFAVPGFPMDPQAYGANLLIQQGATLLHSAQDILNFYETFF